MPDRYAYDFGGTQVMPTTGEVVAAPTFPCAVTGPAPLPTHNIEVAWRRGLDLNPLDLGSAADVDWLKTLVWPEHRDRLARLEQAIDLARTNPPRVDRGDLLRDLAATAADAPSNATLVVFHTAVLNYVEDPADRARFERDVRDLNATWIGNEAPGVFPEAAGRAPPSPQQNLFLQILDGEPVSWVDPHGASIHWFDG